MFRMKLYDISTFLCNLCGWYSFQMLLGGFGCEKQPAATSANTRKRAQKSANERKLKKCAFQNLVIHEVSPEKRMFAPKTC